MAIRALELVARVSSRFVHEILPVATASVIGAMLVNHYGRQPALPSIVVQAQPSASENAIAQSLREDHELLASFAKRREEFVKRRQEQEMDAERSRSGATRAASVAPTRLLVVDPQLPEPQPAAAHIGVARLTPKAIVRKRSAPAEAPLPKPDSRAIASESPPLPDSLRPPAPVEPEPSARPIIRVAGIAREWVADVAQAPGRVTFLPRLPGWPSLPPLIWPLGFFRQD
jgi:hypothetical protein